jgi:peptidylprolyl isomerase
MADTENTLILETTQGPVTIEMRPDLAPGHVARIKELVREGFYDGIVFHRVIDGFMAQTGCPQGTGTGGSGKKLKAEFNKEPHVRGTTSMSAASPDPAIASSSSASTMPRSSMPVHGLGQGDVQAWRTSSKSRGEPVQNPDKIVKARMALDAALPNRHAGLTGVSIDLLESYLKMDADKPGMTCAGPCAPISSISNFPPTASRCVRRVRAIPHGCWWCSPTGCCATASSRIFRNGSSPAISWSSTTPG